MTNTGDWQQRVQECMNAIVACNIAIDELQRTQRQQVAALRALHASLDAGADQ